MKARLGVITCDRCGQPMMKDERTIIVVEGKITEPGEILTFDGSCVHHAYHLCCQSSTSESNTEREFNTRGDECSNISD